MLEVVKIGTRIVWMMMMLTMMMMFFWARAIQLYHRKPWFSRFVVLIIRCHS